MLFLSLENTFAKLQLLRTSTAPQKSYLQNLKFICYICNNDLRKTLNLIQNLTNYNNFDWIPQGQYILNAYSHDENNNILAMDELHFNIETDNPEPERGYGVIHNAMLINMGITTTLTEEEETALEAGDAEIGY